MAAGAVVLALARWIRWVSQFRGPFLENATNSWQDLSSPEWIVIGGLLGSFAWMLAHRRVLTRAVWILMIVNSVAWALFLIFMSGPTEADYREILSRRAAGYAGDGVRDAPTIVADRWFGGFKPLNWDALLGLSCSDRLFHRVRGRADEVRGHTADAR